VGGLQFNTTGYTLGAAANTSALTFGANSNIILNNVGAATFNGSLAGSGNVTLTGGVFGGVVPGTLTLSGTGTGLYTGSTTINNGMTMLLSQNSQALSSTSGITLNGGAINLTNTSLAEAGLNRIANGAGITSNGGTLTVTNSVAAATPYSETIGSVALTSGRLNITSTNANTGGTQSLILSGLDSHGRHELFDRGLLRRGRFRCHQPDDRHRLWHHDGRPNHWPLGHGWHRRQRSDRLCRLQRQQHRFGGHRGIGGNDVDQCGEFLHLQRSHHPPRPRAPSIHCVTPGLEGPPLRSGTGST